MGFLVDNRKKEFCRMSLAGLQSRLVFVDVGSGGPLKTPWTLLPPEHLKKMDFDPEALSEHEQKSPLCISDRDGIRSFHIAQDPRGSSLHRPSRAFIEWFARPDLEIVRTVQVRCETLDTHFGDESGRVDFLDINVEGHDFQVLRGAERLFQAAFPKVVKIEFELAGVWEGQGWFGDIDNWMRQRGLELIDLNFDRIRPAVVRNLFHAGEPVWGKALYAPGFTAWDRRQQQVEPAVFADELRKGIGLFTLLDAPGRAIELLQRHGKTLGEAQVRALRRAIEHTFRLAWVDSVLGLVHRVVARAGRVLKPLS